MESSYNHRRHHSENLDIVSATDSGSFLFDVDTDTDCPLSEQTRRRKETNRGLSRSIHDLGSLDNSLLMDDEIPTRDAGLDLSFSNNASKSRKSKGGSDCNSSLGNETPQRTSRLNAAKRKKRSRREREREASKNNNSLNFREKLERFERGNFSDLDEKSKAEDTPPSPTDSGRPLGWEADGSVDLTITPCNVDTLLVSARFYNQGDVIALCKDALVHCDTDNALYYKFVSDKHELVDVSPYLHDFVRAHFMDIVHTPAFLGLDVDQVVSLLSDTGIKVTSELDVFRAAKGWVDHRKTERLRQAGEVMACVRFHHVTPDDVVRHVEPHASYFRGPGGREVLLGIYRYHALQGSQSDLTELNLELPPPRHYVPLGIDQHHPRATANPRAFPENVSLGRGTFSGPGTKACGELGQYGGSRQRSHHGSNRSTTRVNSHHSDGFGVGDRTPSPPDFALMSGVEEDRGVEDTAVRYSHLRQQQQQHQQHGDAALPPSGHQRSEGRQYLGLDRTQHFQSVTERQTVLYTLQDSETMDALSPETEMESPPPPTRPPPPYPSPSPPPPPPTPPPESPYSSKTQVSPPPPPTPPSSPYPSRSQLPPPPPGLADCLHGKRASMPTLPTARDPSTTCVPSPRAAVSDLGDPRAGVGKASSRAHVGSSRVPSKRDASEGPDGARRGSAHDQRQSRHELSKRASAADGERHGACCVDRASGTQNSGCRLAESPPCACRSQSSRTTIAHSDKTAQVSVTESPLLDHRHISHVELIIPASANRTQSIHVELADPSSERKRDVRDDVQTGGEGDQDRYAICCDQRHGTRDHVPMSGALDRVYSSLSQLPPPSARGNQQEAIGEPTREPRGVLHRGAQTSGFLDSWQTNQMANSICDHRQITVVEVRVLPYGDRPAQPEREQDSTAPHVDSVSQDRKSSTRDVSTSVSRQKMTSASTLTNDQEQDARMEAKPSETFPVSLTKSSSRADRQMSRVPSEVRPASNEIPEETCNEEGPSCSINRVSFANLPDCQASSHRQLNADVFSAQVRSNPSLSGASGRKLSNTDQTERREDTNVASSEMSIKGSNAGLQEEQCVSMWLGDEDGPSEALSNSQTSRQSLPSQCNAPNLSREQSNTVSRQASSLAPKQSKTVTPQASLSKTQSRQTCQSNTLFRQASATQHGRDGVDSQSSSQRLCSQTSRGSVNELPPDGRTSRQSLTAQGKPSNLSHSQSNTVNGQPPQTQRNGSHTQYERLKSPSPSNTQYEPVNQSATPTYIADKNIDARYSSLPASYQDLREASVHNQCQGSISGIGDKMKEVSMEKEHAQTTADAEPQPTTARSKSLVDERRRSFEALMKPESSRNVAGTTTAKDEVGMKENRSERPPPGDKGGIYHFSESVVYSHCDAGGPCSCDRASDAKNLHSAKSGKQEKTLSPASFSGRCLTEEELLEIEQRVRERRKEIAAKKTSSGDALKIQNDIQVVFSDEEEEEEGEGRDATYSQSFISSQTMQVSFPQSPRPRCDHSTCRHGQCLSRYRRVSSRERDCSPCCQHSPPRPHRPTSRYFRSPPRREHSCLYQNCPSPPRRSSCASPPWSGSRHVHSPPERDESPSCRRQSRSPAKSRRRSPVGVRRGDLASSLSEVARSPPTRDPPPSSPSGCRQAPSLEGRGCSTREAAEAAVPAPQRPESRPPSIKVDQASSPVKPMKDHEAGDQHRSQRHPLTPSPSYATWPPSKRGLSPMLPLPNVSGPCATRAAKQCLLHRGTEKQAEEGGACANGLALQREKPRPDFIGESDLAFKLKPKNKLHAARFRPIEQKSLSNDDFFQQQPQKENEYRVSSQKINVRPNTRGLTTAVSQDDRSQQGGPFRKGTEQKTDNQNAHNFNLFGQPVRCGKSGNSGYDCTPAQRYLNNCHQDGRHRQHRGIQQPEGRAFYNQPRPWQLGHQSALVQPQEFQRHQHQPQPMFVNNPLLPKTSTAAREPQDRSSPRRKAMPLETLDSSTLNRSRNDNSPIPEGQEAAHYTLGYYREYDEPLDEYEFSTGLAYRDHPYSSHDLSCAMMEAGESLILAVGGLDPKHVDPEVPCRLVQLYDPTTDVWSLLAKMPDPRHHHGCVMLDGFLYVIGGSVVLSDDLYNMCNATKSCYRYDFGGNFWTVIAPMMWARMYHSVAVLEGVIYALGGEASVTPDEEPKFLETCEYYNADSDEWGPIASMLDATVGAATVGFNGQLWVIGGFVEHGDDNIVLASVECYDPRTNSWASRHALPYPVCHASVAEVGGTLVLVGGSNVRPGLDQPVVSTGCILEYHEDGDFWTQYAALAIPRHDAGCCVIGTHLFILGGVSSATKGVLTKTECVDVATGDWLHDLKPLPSPALGLACVSLKPEDFETITE